MTKSPGCGHRLDLETIRNAVRPGIGLQVPRLVEKVRVVRTGPVDHRARDEYESPQLGRTRRVQQLAAARRLELVISLDVRGRRGELEAG